MVRSLNLTEARNTLTKLPDELADGQEAVAITRRGKPVLAIMPWELFEVISETLEIMADEEMMQAFRAGVEDLRAGRLHDWEQVKAELGA